MVFSSIPAYLDPSNWHQQQTQQHHQVIGSGSGSGNGNGNGNPLLPPHVGPGSIRPGSMAERARMANIPLPEPALKCPRCDSTNTKFCYFNNYSLSQPRHFCKTCRRYWTRGGALRTVPVGGGCRRNKRTKSSSTSSKSPAASTPPPAASTPPPTTTTTTYVNNSYNNILGLPPMRFASQFNEGFSGLSGYNNGISMNNFVQGNFLEGDNGGGNINIIEPWRMQQQFPNFMEPSPTSQFHVGESSFVQRSRFSSSILGQEQAAGSVKMEERHPPPPPHPQEVNLSTRQLMLGGLMAPAGNEPWSNNNNNNNNATNAPSWTELASFSSSSTSNPL